MSDRELFELVAKAAGIELVFERDIPQRIEMFRGHLANYEDWNPLTDDGDALRLAVKLKIGIEIYDDWVDASTNFSFGSANQKISDDPYAATRRAIVRAAAEIGKEMP